MKKIIDSDQKEIVGLYRDDIGSIIVKNDVALAKHIAAKNKALKENALMDRMDRIEKLVEQLLNKIS